jgi:hypothetical protein
LLEDGWLRSFQEGRPVDRSGAPIPFLTYPAIDFLAARARPEMTVFEYGSGASTLWWASRVASVQAAEHHPEWHALVSKKLPANATVHLRSLDDKVSYPRLAIDTGGQYSLIAIDGRLRVRCSQFAVDALSPSGVILWDDSQRSYYEPGYRALHQRGFRRLDFSGLRPTVNEKTTTSIFYRDGNCLGI